VVEAPLKPWGQQSAAPAKSNGALLLAPLAALLLIVLLAALLVSGHWPELRSMVPFTSKGLVAAFPSRVTRIEIQVGQANVTLRRGSAVWTIDEKGDTAPAELASHIDTGLQLLHVSQPARDIAAGELTPASLAEFGLDPPAIAVVLGMDDGTVATVNFGVLNPAGTSQYVRLAGAATVYLMGRHVGTEWQVAGDMARRLRAQIEPAISSRGTNLILPVSLAQVWAVEIVFAGKLTRFERDGTGNWFKHVGQHSHSGNANAHIADPAQARVIDAALEAFDATPIETRIAPGTDAVDFAHFGLALPSLIVLLYARDSSTALARLELGTAAGDFDRYARLAPNGDIVTVPEFEVRRLTELLKAVGAGS
jgi:Domain of unknown function (DUF4340)